MHVIFISQRGLNSFVQLQQKLQAPYIVLYQCDMYTLILNYVKYPYRMWEITDLTSSTVWADTVFSSVSDSTAK